MSIISEKIKALREAYVELGQDVSRFSDDALLSMALGTGPAPVPAWADKTAAERVEALREDYARMGEDISDLSDAELLNRELTRMQAESRRHENAYSTLLQDQVKYDRSVYASANRTAREAVDARGSLYLNAIIRRSAVPLTGLIYRISQLPERPGPKQVEELKGAARTVEWQLDGVVTAPVIREVAEHDEGVKLVEAQRAEITRLRKFITEQGQALHAAHGPRKGEEGRCECPGCELIRSMDDDRETVPAEG